MGLKNILSSKEVKKAGSRFSKDVAKAMVFSKFAKKASKKVDLKDELAKAGISISKEILKVYLISRLTKGSSQTETTEKVKKSKLKRVLKFTGSAVMAILIKELVLDRVLAKLNPKPKADDFSWILDYPIRDNLFNLNDDIASLKEDSKVLDLGSGSGYFAIAVGQHLSEKGKVCCVDINNISLRELQASAAEAELENIELHRAYIEDLPFEGDFFDAAFLNMTLGQIEDKIQALQEVHRVLKKGGKLFVTDLLADNYYCLASTVINYAYSVGFKPVTEKGSFVNYTIILQKD